jgi:4-hydroxy-tetrahydrodipicolinate synthase
MAGPGRFGTVLTAMVTPFDDDGALDLDAAQTLARHLVDNGSDGLVVAGSTGEASTLTDDEKRDLWRAVVEAVTVPVVAGSTSNDTAHSVHLTKAATDAGVAGILGVGPYYNRPSQAGLEAHFRAVAAATDLPVLIYDIPIRTGRKISNDVLVRLAREVDNIVGIKDATLDVGSSARLMAAAPDGFELYSGNDDQTLYLLALGCCGLIGVATHWAAGEFGEMITSFHKGDVDAARRMNERLLESCDFESSNDAPNPVPTKALLRTLGLKVGECRLPMGPTPPGLEDRAREVLANLRA